MNRDHSEGGLSRRAFVGLSIASVMLPLMPAVAQPASAQLGVFDSRFAEARAFGSSLIARNIAAISFEGDITGVWIRHLDPAWRLRSAPVVAGLTTRQALFCFERLAWDRGLRVLERAELGKLTTFAGTHPDSLTSWVIGKS